MSGFNLGTKFQPANKAWKNFTTKFKSKLQKFKISKAIKRTKHHHHNYHQCQNNFSAIYVDKLYEGPVWHAAKMKKQKEEKRDLDEKALKRKSNSVVGETSTLDLASAWKVAVDSLPHIRGVDERAEEFISKFREEMNIQREQSILDFQEMLARSS